MQRNVVTRYADVELIDETWLLSDLIRVKMLSASGLQLREDGSVLVSDPILMLLGSVLYNTSKVGRGGGEKCRQWEIVFGHLCSSE